MTTFTTSSDMEKKDDDVPGVAMESNHSAATQQQHEGDEEENDNDADSLSTFSLMQQLSSSQVMVVEHCDDGGGDGVADPQHPQEDMEDEETKNHTSSTRHGTSRSSRRSSERSMTIFGLKLMAGTMFGFILLATGCYLFDVEQSSLSLPSQRQWQQQQARYLSNRETAANPYRRDAKRQTNDVVQRQLEEGDNNNNNNNYYDYNNNDEEEEEEDENNDSDNDYTIYSCADLYATVGYDDLNAQCQYAKQCNFGDGLSMSFVFCSEMNSMVYTILLSPIWIVALITLFRMLGSTAEDYFSPALEMFSVKLGLPPRFAGVSLLALGNGAADVSATMNAITSDPHTGYLLSLGALTGAGMFISTVVAGLVIVTANGVPCRGALVRDVVMFTVTVSVVYYEFSSGVIGESAVMLFFGLYTSFVVVVLMADIYHRAVVLPRIEEEQRQKELDRQLMEERRAKAASQKALMEFTLQNGNSFDSGAGITVNTHGQIVTRNQTPQRTIMQTSSSNPNKMLELQNISDGSRRGLTRTTLHLGRVRDDDDEEKNQPKMDAVDEASEYKESNSLAVAGAGATRGGGAGVSSRGATAALDGTTSAAAATATTPNRHAAATATTPNRQRISRFGRMMEALSNYNQGQTRFDEEGNPIEVDPSDPNSPGVVDSGWGVDVEHDGIVVFHGRHTLKRFKHDVGEVATGGSSPTRPGAAAAAAAAATASPDTTAPATEYQPMMDDYDVAGGDAPYNPCVEGVGGVVGFHVGALASHNWSSAFSEAWEEFVQHWIDFYKSVYQNDDNSFVDKFVLSCEMPFTIARQLTVPVPCEGYYCRPVIALGLCLAPLWFALYCDLNLDVNMFHSPVYGFVLVTCIVMGLLTIRYAPRDTGTNDSNMSMMFAVPIALFGFVVAATWIDFIASQLVGVLGFLGVVFHIPGSIMGMTVLAWGNSIADLAADITMAKKGLANMAITACFAGPIFNILMGLGLGFKSMMLETHQNHVDIMIFPSNVKAGILFLIINCAAVLVFGLIWKKGRVPLEYGYCGLFLYASYLVTALTLYFTTES